MVFTEKDKRSGTTHIVCSRYWPDGERFRRRCPNKTVANNLLARINGAIATGKWVELRKELTEKPDEKKDFTIAEFADVYLDEYCRIRNSRPDFKEETLEVIKGIVGNVKLREFGRSHALQFETERSRQVGPATVNRGLAVLSNMLTFAYKKELIQAHPMLLYGRLPVDEKERRFMTVEEERTLVRAVTNEDVVVGGYVAILGETGIRMEEGLKLKWEHIDSVNRLLTVTASKNAKVRHVPLSDNAVEVLRGLPRFIGNPWVFVRLSTKRRLSAPRKEFEIGKQVSKLTWVKGFHDLRHFRASQWIRSGIDVRTVKELLGHSDIKTTMIYAHFDPNHAHKAILQAQRLEVAIASGNK